MNNSIGEDIGGDTIDDMERAQFLSYFQSTGIPPPITWDSESDLKADGKSDDAASECTDITVSSTDLETRNSRTTGNPVFLAPSSRIPGLKFSHAPMYNPDGSLKGSIPMDGTPVRVSSPLFEGVMVNRVKGMGDHKYFDGRKRTFQWSLQVKFKRRIRFDLLVTGQDFKRPFRNLPNAGLIDKGLHLLKNRLPDVFDSRLGADEPIFEHALINGCQHFRIDDPGRSGPMFDLFTGAKDGNIVEDTSLLNDPNVPKDSEKRKRYFSKLENLQKFYYEPEYVYTFNFYANFFNMTRYSFDLTSFFRIEVAPFFNGYPVFMAMLKDKTTDEFILATEMWHRQLLEFDEKPGGIARLFARKKMNH